MRWIFRWSRFADLERETVAICERGERGVGESSQVSGEEVVDASRN